MPDRLIGNPTCLTSQKDSFYCQIQQLENPYSTSLVHCGTKTCSGNQKLNPQGCGCAYPYDGTIFFRAPSFRGLSNASLFHSLEKSLWAKIELGPVSLQNPFFDDNDYLEVQLQIFPLDGKYLNRSEVQRIGFSLSNQTYKPPVEFGPYHFIANQYTFEGINLSSSKLSSRK